MQAAQRDLLLVVNDISGNVMSERQGGLHSSTKGSRLGVTGWPWRGRKGAVAAMRERRKGFVEGTERAEVGGGGRAKVAKGAAGNRTTS